MLLAALLELGAPRATIEAELAGLGVPELVMVVRRVHRGTIAAGHLSFAVPARDPVERRFATIRALLERAQLQEAVRERSIAVFTRLAEAEARVHGVVPEQVHFHEVGALDALGDIVGVCAALSALGIGRVTASPLALGHGFVDGAHGRLPLPAPATVELLRGVPTYPAGVAWETVTPTGAALIGTLVDGFGPMPAMRPEAQGFGAGEVREGPLPNVLRAVLGAPAPWLEADQVSVIETNLDDMNPEHLPFLVEQLLDDGALDVSLSPLAMKKGRPGQLLRVIVRPADRDRLARRVLRGSSALGVRFQEMSRLKQVREAREVQTRFGRVALQQARSPEGEPEITPEYESCARAARLYGVPLRVVYDAALRAARGGSG